MTRDQLIVHLAAGATPLGPMSSYEAYRQAWEGWLSAASPGWVDPLLSLLIHPPVPPPAADPDAWAYAVEEALWRCARSDPAAFLRRAATDILDPRSRPTLLNVLGSLRDPGAAPILRSLLDRVALSPEEQGRLAAALGEIGGPEAKGLLLRLRDATSGSSNARAEIEAALGLVDLPTAERDDLLGIAYAPPA